MTCAHSYGGIAHAGGEVPLYPYGRIKHYGHPIYRPRYRPQAGYDQNGQNGNGQSAYEQQDYNPPPQMGGNYNDNGNENGYAYNQGPLYDGGKKYSSFI